MSTGTEDDPMNDNIDVGDNPTGDEGFAPSYADYTTEDLLELAQANAQATLIATVAFLQERGVPLADWTAALGRRYDVAWDEPEPWDADEFLDAVLVNLRSLGALVVSADLSVDRAEAITTGFPDPDACDRFGADLPTVIRFHDATAPIAAARGLRWSWALEDPAEARTRFVVVRDEGFSPEPDQT